MPEESSIQRNPRPLSPRLSIYRWHPEMVASLAHRASGIVLVLFVPFYLWLLHGMTGSPEDFKASLALLHTGLGRLTLWLVGSSLIYHFCNGIRFICLDAGWGESRAAMRAGAQFMLLVAAVSAVALGVLLW
ncbi:MAG: succinate dehydrogenase, cytochrome b556 subunit [Mariprofundaceae bacterium]|nr:succinate dehydrogenase, cytochrome b556 subunit [Mariprofundaceae bacterium]